MARLLRLLPFLPVAVLAAVLSGSDVPPGADLPRQVGYGQAILSGGTAPYPPLWPATLALTWHALGGLDAFLAVARFLPLLPIAALAGAAFALGRALSGLHGGLAASALVAADHSLWVAMAWGGHAQSLSLACCLGAAAAWLSHKRDKSAWPAALLAALAWGFNPYPPLLLAPAAVVFAWRRPWLRPSRRSATVLVAVHLALGVLWLPAYLATAQAWSTGSPAHVFQPWLIMATAPFQFLVAWRLWIISGALATGALLLRGRAPTWARTVLLALGSAVAAAALLQFVTFTNLTGRIVYVSSVAFAMLGALVATHKLPRRRVGSAVLAALLVVLPIGTLRAVDDVAYYSPLDAADIAALGSAPPGDAVIFAPVGDVDAAWLETLHGGRAVEPRKDWRYWPSEDLAAARAAAHLRQGVAGFDDGTWSIVESGCTRQALRVNFDDGHAMRLVASVPDAGIRVDGMPVWPQWTTSIHGPVVRSTAPIEGGDLVRELYLDAGRFVIDWAAPRVLTVEVAAPSIREDGGWSLAPEARGRYTPSVHLAAANGTLGPDGITFHLDGHASMRFQVPGLEPAAPITWTDALLGAGYEWAYARADERDRFAQRAPVWQHDDIAIYALTPGPTCA